MLNVYKPSSGDGSATGPPAKPERTNMKAPEESVSPRTSFDELGRVGNKEAENRQDANQSSSKAEYTGVRQGMVDA